VVAAFRGPDWLTCAHPSAGALPIGEPKIWSKNALWGTQKRKFCTVRGVVMFTRRFPWARRVEMRSSAGRDACGRKRRKLQLWEPQRPNSAGCRGLSIPQAAPYRPDTLECSHPSAGSRPVENANNGPSIGSAENCTLGVAKAHIPQFAWACEAWLLFSAAQMR